MNALEVKKRRTAKAGQGSLVRPESFAVASSISIPFSESATTTPANVPSPRLKGRRKRGSQLHHDGIVIRQMELDDLYQVYTLGEQLFDEQRWPNLYRTWDPFVVTETFNTDDEFCLVAEDREKEMMIGFCLGFPVFKSRWKYGYLEWLAIHTDYQRKGVAKLLFERFRDIMKYHGIQMLIIDTQADNIPALKFFGKLGFKNPNPCAYFSVNITQELIDTLTPKGVQSLAPHSLSIDLPLGKNGSNGGTPAPLVIRPMELKDLSRVFRIGEKIFTTKLGQNYYRAWDEFEVIDHFDPASGLGLVAELNGKVIGFCLACKIAKSSGQSFGYITWVGVEAECRRKGVATCLLYAVLKQFLQEGTATAFVDTSVENKPAMALIEKCNFGNPKEHLFLDLNLERLDEIEQQQKQQEEEAEGGDGDEAEGEAEEDKKQKEEDNT